MIVTCPNCEAIVNIIEERHKTRRKIPTDCIPLMIASKEKCLSVFEMYHWSIHKEDHACGLHGCKLVGFRVPECLVYQFKHLGSNT